MCETLRPLPRLCEVGDSPGNATTDGCLVRVRGRGRGRGRVRERVRVRGRVRGRVSVRVRVRLRVGLGIGFRRVREGYGEA